MNSNDKNRNLDQDPASRAADTAQKNRKNNSGKTTDSKTFNEDESSYSRKNSETKNAAGQNTSYSFTDNYSEEERWGADYINSDHSDYNRNNSRFYWDDYDV
jgi:hypothetical protein